MPTPTPTIGYVYLSEVYPYPESGENEWVELYNDNEFPVTLKNWKIDDVENGGSSPKSFSLVIGGYSFASFDISSSMFNNDGDDVRLLDENNTLHDSFTYETAEQGNSIGRMDFLTNVYCIQPPSRSLVNNACLSDHIITMTPTPTKKPSPTPTKYPTASLPKRNISITPTTYIPQIRNTVSAVYSKASSEGGTVLGEDTAADTEGGGVEVLDLQDEQYRDMAQFFSISSAVSSFLTLAVVFIKMML